MSDDEPTDPGYEYDHAPLLQCRHCGGDIRSGDFIARVGGLQTYGCPRCGGQSFTTASFQLVGLPPAAPRRLFAVQFDWDPKEPAGSVFAILEQLMPGLREAPPELRELFLDVLRDGPPIISEVAMLEADADALIAAAEAAGIRASKQ